MKKKKKVFVMYADESWEQAFRMKKFKVVSGINTYITFTKLPTDVKVRITVEEI